MDSNTIYTKTAKGLKEAVGKTSHLSRELRNILKEIDGQTSVAALQDKLGNLSESKLQNALTKLAAEDFIREFAMDAESLLDGDFSQATQVIEHGDEEADHQAWLEAMQNQQTMLAKESDIKAAEPKAVESKAAESPAKPAPVQVAAPEKQEAPRPQPASAQETVRPEDEAEARRKAEAQARRLAWQEAQQAKRAAEEQAKREAEEKAKKEAEEQARRKEEQKAQREAEEQARQEAKAQAKKEAEEKARLKAEEKAKKEAEEKARRAAEKQAREEAEEKARKAKQEAKEQAQQQAEEEAKRKAEEKAKRDEEEQAAREVEKQARLEAKEKAKEEEARRKAEEQAEKEAAKAATEASKLFKKPVKWGKPVMVGLMSLVIIGLGVIHFIPFGSQAQLFEKMASGQLQQPVKIKNVYLSLFPQPHWRLEGVAIGKDGQIKVGQVKTMAELGTLFTDKIAIKSVEFDSPVLTEEGLGWLLFNQSQAQAMKPGSVKATNARLNSQAVTLGVFDMKTEMAKDGKSEKIVLNVRESGIHIELQPKGGTVQIAITADSFAMPFGSTLTLDKFSATGTVARNELSLTEFNGSLYDGALKGSARLKWGGEWSLDGDLSMKQVDMVKLFPELLETGTLEGAAHYELKAQTPDKLFASPRVEGNFTVRDGTLVGVDLAKLIRNANSSGKSQFAALSGSFVTESGKTQLRKVSLNAGILSAGGTADVDDSKNLSGRFVVDLKSAQMQARANVALSGTVTQPKFSH